MKRFALVSIIFALFSISFAVMKEEGQMFFCIVGSAVAAIIAGFIEISEVEKKEKETRG